MQKKIASFLFSTRLTGILFIVFAIAMGIGTFLDAQQTTSPTPYSRTLVYNAWWFEAIMVVFVINFIGNIPKYGLWRKEKWSMLIIHLSFILIIFGAFITRYIGYEGVIAIREGATENTMLSEKVYLTTLIDGDYEIDGVPQRRKHEKRLLLSERLDNDFEIQTDYNDQPITIEYVDYIKGAVETVVPAESGMHYLKLVEAEGGNRHSHWLKDGEVSSIHGVLFALNNFTEGAINIIHDEENGYQLYTPFSGGFTRMADQMEGRVVEDSLQPLQLRSLYQMAGMGFVIPDPIVEGEFDLVKATEEEPSNMDALVVKATTNNEAKIVKLLGGQGFVPKPTTVELGGLEFHFVYGSKEIELPFSITLNDFIAEKYPGTETAYSSFMSKVTVNNPDNTSFDYDIYMNNILDHKGYRFFQASFDPDELGTVLSVNHDFWGTWTTYIGYLLLYFGLMAILFDKNSRFGSLKKMLDKVKKKKAALSTLALLLVGTFGFSQDAHQHRETEDNQLDSIIFANVVDKDHAAKFGQLVIQDEGGRMKPVNTFASELLRKVSKSDHYKSLDANQVFLSMSEFPRLWVEIPLIRLKRGNDSIRKVLDVSEDRKNVSLIEMFDSQGNSKIGPYLEEASKKATPDQFEKDLLKTYESLYLLNQGLSGTILRIFPIPDDQNNTWVSFPELQSAGIQGSDSLYTRNILPLYFRSLKDARETGDYSKADEYLESITNYQKRHGSSIMPSENRVKAEILYNKIDIFNRLYTYFLLIGILMFVFLIVQIFKDKNKLLSRLVNICKYIIWFFFILMTLGLILRWYVSGHAPWSDAYESVIYVAWATVFFGLAFGRKSNLTIASTAFVASIVLWVAHQNWMDPSIANLQPVLDSYWLMIHVSVIVGSYGPFTLGMILGATALLLMILTTKKNKAKMDINIRELTIINEMALTVGIVLLTIGNFLGGMWANESWGRYWGWDPKETWALISIMVYAFVIHMRLIPGLRSRWFYNVMSIVAFAAIMMTYFGVNFYLVGLHSYASGDKPITPAFIYYTVGFVIILSTVAYFKDRKYYSKIKK
tara:strand:- start:140891 stop:144061 length:3171 start_codon:yes stop_codon:yes gene_type:complete